MILQKLIEKKNSIMKMIQEFIEEYGDEDDEFVWEQIEELEEVNESIAYYMAIA